MLPGRHLAALVALCGSAGLLQGCGSAADSSGGGDASSTPAAAATTTTTTTTTAFSGWNCTSNQQLDKGVVAAEKKGFCVDDTTFDDCADEFFNIWPHSTDRVSSFRLFAAWKPEWKGDRETKWKELKEMLDRTDSTILLGAEIQKGNDCDQQFQWALELMKVLGRKRVLAFAFGNEIDYHGGPPDGYWEMIQRYTKEIDDAGFEDMPITAVFSQQVIGLMKDGGFYLDLLQKAHTKYGKRWIWSFNSYSIWDGSVNPHNSGDCDAMTEIAVSIDYIQGTSKAFGEEITKIVGSEDFEMWITETGWSSPFVLPNQAGLVGICPKWGAPESLYTLYKNVAEWDLKTGGKAVDRLFYFAMRDHYFNGEEAFGLVERCGDRACKIQDKIDGMVVV